MVFQYLHFKSSESEKMMIAKEANHYSVTTSSDSSFKHIADGLIKLTVSISMLPESNGPI